MSIPALLLFIFAPLFLSALVRVRAVAVLSALIVAASLSANAPALAQTGRSAPEWVVDCQTDEWDDTPHCHTYAGAVNRNLDIVHHCETGEDGKVEEFVYFVDGFRGFETANGKWDSGGIFILYKVQIRWDKEPAHDAIMMRNEGEGGARWWRINTPSDWWGWKILKMTPTTFPNPIRLLQEKSQLRIRDGGDTPTVYTFSLAGAASAIAEARRHCGL